LYIFYFKVRLTLYKCALAFVLVSSGLGELGTGLFCWIIELKKEHELLKSDHTYGCLAVNIDSIKAYEY